MQESFLYSDITHGHFELKLLDVKMESPLLLSIIASYFYK